MVAFAAIAAEEGPALGKAKPLVGRIETYVNGPSVEGVPASAAAA
jgi:hypothetical protein